MNAPSGIPATAAPAPSAQQIAQASADAMWPTDRATQALGITLQQVGPGSATMQMTVREDMLNGHGTCHGGYLALFADSAFAFACNAYNELTVASGFDVQFLAPAQAGDRLTAQCEEQSKTGRTGLYDVVVRREDGSRVALFRGRSYTMKGKALVEGLPIGPQGKPAR